MKKNIFLVITLIPLLSFVLKPLHYLRSKVKMTNLLVLPPVSLISVIENGSTQQIDKELSEKEFYVTSDLLKKCIPDSIEHEYFFPDSMQQVRLNKFVVGISNEINSSKQARKYFLPDSIINLFNTSKVDFVFCTHNAGFIRTTSNAVNNHLASDLTGFVFGITWRSFKSAAVMNCFILDLKQKNILFFERNVWNNRDPTDANVIKIQLTPMVNHYFL